MTFANTVGPVARLRTDDGYYMCNGHYVSAVGADCNNFVSVPPLETPFPMYPWPFQQLYLFKSVGVNMG